MRKIEKSQEGKLTKAYDEFAKRMSYRLEDIKQ